MNDRGHRVTVKDVAKRAGVSQTTVSRVLNNFPVIKESTRQKVLDAIQELGFKPDQIARSLVKQQTNIIGLIVGDISNPFYAETAKVIIARAQEMDYDIILCDTNYANDHFEKSIKMLLDKRVAGIIVASVNRFDARIRELCEQDFPVVLYNRNVDDECANYIVLDNKKGAMMAVEHLVSLGHRKIAYVSGPDKYSTFHQRLLGYQEALKKCGIPYNPAWIYNGEFSYEKVFLFAKELMMQADRPTSFFAATDQMAIAVMDAAANCRLSVPEDVSIIGFDNINMASNPYIGLTTISQQKKKMAMLALENLIDLINGRKESKPIHMVLEPELIIRKTTGKSPRQQISLGGL